MNKLPLQISSMNLLDDVKTLRSRFGDFDSIHIKEIESGGYSGAKFSQVCLTQSSIGEVRLVLKELKLREDWFSFRTNDLLGREAAVLLCPELSYIYSIFLLPYELICIDSGRIGLLMQDVSDGLFPDERKSIQLADQDLILDKLAQMHAHYWQSPAMDSLPWLHRMEDFIYIMGPLDHPIDDQELTNSLQKSIKTGWEAVMKLLPDQIKKVFLLPPNKIIAPWKDLPMTLVHGDTKVANFAKNTNGELYLLDWAFVGHAPCTFDIGWFLAVNASRLAESKEAVLEKYRNLLERYLGHSLDDELWRRLEEAGIISGAFMLLWSKGIAVANKREGAIDEWNWWIQRLENWAKKFQS